mmetsp:Transcript_44272/g.82711  ORF Transcript_44272/g.82711 Transcript_44272/m.82711 type:complete len:234 (+) Transcript_44272:212-913(+)
MGVAIVWLNCNSTCVVHALYHYKASTLKAQEAEGSEPLSAMACLRHQEYFWGKAFLRATSLLRNQLSFRGWSPEALEGLKKNSVGVLVAMVDGDEEGAEDEHGDPSRVLDVGPAVQNSLSLLRVNPAGTSPHRRSFSQTIIHVRRVSAASSLGIVPERSFPQKRIIPALVRAASSLGIVPLSWLERRQNSVTRVSAANSLGMVPVSWLRSKSKFVSLVRVASSLGIVPVSWLA